MPSIRFDPLMLLKLRIQGRPGVAVLLAARRPDMPAGAAG